MSTQWKKLSEEQPMQHQPIWFVDTLSPDVRPRCITWEPYMRISPTMFWQSAEPPPPPPDDSEAAFEEWWNNYRIVPGADFLRADFLTPKAFSKVAWNAALAWHKNKTKE